MTAQDRERFAAALTALAEVFDVEVSDAKLSLYFDALKDMDWPEFNKAVTCAARSLKFFPKPSELRATVFGDDDAATERAWIAWKQAALHVGSYASLIVRDPALADTLTAVFGGWPDACTAELSPEMWSSKRKEFDRVYRVMRQRGLSGARYLAGITEQHNSGHGLRFAADVGLIDGAIVRKLAHAEAEQLRADLQGGGYRKQLDAPEPVPSRAKLTLVTE